MRLYCAVLAIILASHAVTDTYAQTVDGTPGGNDQTAAGEPVPQLPKFFAACDSDTLMPRLDSPGCVNRNETDIAFS